MLQGNSKNLPLQNIFQTLALNQQEGILTVSHQRFERHIAIRKSGTSLLCERPYTSKILQKVVARLKILTPSEYENIFNATPVQASPGDVLVQCQVLNPAQVIDVLREQVLEFVYEIFEWRDANYRFEVREVGPERVIFTHPELRRRLEFPVNAILMEVVRREDEWNRIREVIPSAYQIYQWSDSAGAATQHASAVNMDAARVRTLYDLIDGERTLEEIVEASRIPPFFVFSTLRALIEEGHLRPITLGDKKKLTERLRQKFQLERVATIYLSILDEAPEEADIRRKLVIYLERKKAPIADLLPHYRKLALTAYQQADFPNCQGYLERILSHDELDVDAAELMALCQLQAGKDRAWQQATSKYIGVVRRTRQFDRGAAFLLQVAEAKKTEGWLVQEAAHLYLLGGNPQSAAANYDRAARLFQATGDQRSLAQCVEKLEVCDADAASRWTRQLQLGTGGRERSRGRVKALVVCAVVTGVVAFGIYEGDARITYAEVFAAANSHAALGDMKRASQLMNDFDRDHRFSLVARQIPADLAHLERLASKHATASALEHLDGGPADHMGDDVEQLISKGSAHKRRGDYALALQHYRAIQAGALPPQLSEMVAAEIAFLDRYLADAEALVGQARASEHAGNLQDANGVYQKLVTHYPYSPVIASVRIPIILDVQPPDAIVLVDNQRVTGPPFVVRVAPGHEPVVSVSAPTFVSKTTSVDPRQGYMAVLHLGKEAAWTKSLPAWVEAAPCAFDDRLFLGTRSGSVLCVDAATGDTRWEFKLDEAGDCLGGVRRFEDSVVFTGTDRAFYRVRASDGSKVFRLARVGFARVPVTEPDAAGRTFVATTQQKVFALDVAAGTVVWERMVLGSGDLPVVVSGNSLFVAARSGKLTLLDATSGERRWFLEQNTPICATPVVVEDIALVPFENGRLAALATADGTTRWERSTEAPLTGAAAGPASGHVVILARNGALESIDVRTGKSAWRVSLGGHFTQPPAVHARSIFVVDDGGSIRVLTESGARLWGYDTGTKPSAPLLAVDSVLYFAGSDRTVHGIVIEQSRTSE